MSRPLRVLLVVTGLIGLWFALGSREAAVEAGALQRGSDGAPRSAPVGPLEPGAGGALEPERG